MSIQGFMKTALLKQGLHQTLLEESNSGLRDDVGHLRDIMNAFLAVQGMKTSRGVKRKAMDDLSTLIECTFKHLSLTFTQLTLFSIKLVQYHHPQYQTERALSFLLCQMHHHWIVP